MGRSFFFGKDKDYCANLALKMNLKAGGTNRVLPNDKLGVIADGNTMVVGIDVTHPSPGSGDSAPSVAAMVASIDTKLGQWPVDLRINKSRQEMVEEDNIKAMLKSSLNLWMTKNHTRLPQNILIYCDGVSEGQYEDMIKQEFHPMQELCNTDYKRYGQDTPHIMLIVVSKRYHTAST